MADPVNREHTPCVICVGGSATIDHIFLVDEVRLPSAKITALDFIETGGGMGANAAVAVQRLGGRAIYWGRVGDDQTGDEVLWLLTHEGIDVSGVRRLPGFRTKIASILIDAHGERLAVSAQPQGYPPDASWLPVERVPEANVVLADTRWPTGAQRLFETAAEFNLPSVFDGDGGDPAETLVRDRYPNPLLAERLRSLAAVPLLGGDQAIGVLHVGTVEPRRFTEDDDSAIKRNLIFLAVEGVQPVSRRVYATLGLRLGADHVALIETLAREGAGTRLVRDADRWSVLWHSFATIGVLVGRKYHLELESGAAFAYTDSRVNISYTITLGIYGPVSRYRSQPPALVT